MDLALNYLPMLLAVLGGAVVALAALAPLTKNTKDDAALGVLRKVEAFLLSTIMPFLSTRVASKKVAEKSEAAAAVKAANKAGK